MWQIEGQDDAVRYLERSLRDGRLSHAYLITGPPHVGKMTLAIGLAQAVNCEGENPPCGQCQPCPRIASGKHADVRVIGLQIEEGQSQTRTKTEISIDSVREIQQAAYLPPYEGKTKVFIIDGAEHLSTEAANCLLKTLEEPPPRVLLILLATSEHLLLPTVTSRCQRLELRPLSTSKVREILVKLHGTDPDQTELLAHLSEGRLGWALTAMQDNDPLERREQGIAPMLEVVTSDYEKRLALAASQAQRFAKSRKEAVGLLDLWLSYWRDVLMLKMGHAEAVTNIDHGAALNFHTVALTTAEIRDAIDRIQQAKNQISSNANSRLAFEVLMLHLPKRDSIRPSAIASGA